MNWIKRSFHFLGGVYLAIALIAIMAVTVAAGTALESYTGSHLFAAQWTYHHPLFAILLCFFFINILFAALRRWPFRPHHVPFLITHLGLLMVIGGTLIKNRWGLQGHLSVWEGSGSQSLFIPQTHALHIEKKVPQSNTILSQLYPLSLDGRQVFQMSPFSTLKVKVLGHLPHVSEKWETWIKGGHLHFLGIPPLSAYEWKSSQGLPQDHRLPLRSGYAKGEEWSIWPLRTDHIQEAIQHAYLENLTLRLSTLSDESEQLECSLKEALQHPLDWKEGQVTTKLFLAYSPLLGFDQPYLMVNWQANQGERKESVQMALQGSRALYLTSDEFAKPASSSFNVDLIRSHPALLAVEDSHQNAFLFAFDLHGRVYGEAFHQGQLNTLYTYDQGFGGYFIQALFPIPPFPSGRKEKEQADLYFFSQQLRQTLSTPSRLAPPLDLFQKACQRAHVDFVEALIAFLTQWNHSRQLLFSPLHLSPLLERALKQLDWKESPSNEREACQWICQLFEQLERPYRAGEDLLAFLQANKWPFLTDLESRLQQDQKKEVLFLLAQQIFSFASYLPRQQRETEPNLWEQARLLSAYLKAYGIDYQAITPLPEKGPETFERLQNYWKSHAHFQAKDLVDDISHAFLTLETPLSICYRSEPPLPKVEDNCPCLLLEIQEGARKQFLSLAYDPAGFGLKWPILNGDYLIRFQPQYVQIPYRIRLRQARQINYPHSQQAYSYEGDVLIAGLKQLPVEETLSMNHVHETWEGYRFYLAGMSTTPGQTAKRVQIVVNHDPAKYLLTYPGAAVVIIGILLLFWTRPYRRAKNKDPRG